MQNGQMLKKITVQPRTRPKTEITIRDQISGMQNSVEIATTILSLQILVLKQILHYNAGTTISQPCELLDYFCSHYAVILQCRIYAHFPVRLEEEQDMGLE